MGTLIPLASLANEIISVKGHGQLYPPRMGQFAASNSDPEPACLSGMLGPGL